MALSTESGSITEATPSTSRRLSMFEPTTLPIAIPLEPLNAAVILTAASGALVPIATIVSPTMISGMLKRLAIELLPSTKKSAPFTRMKKPNASKK